MQPLTLFPAASARFAAAWIIGPSATGSEKGISTTSIIFALPQWQRRLGNSGMDSSRRFLYRRRTFHKFIFRTMIMPYAHDSFDCEAASGSA